ncbi:ABC transporter permease [Rheinheimera pacifica]|uniref:Putative ABC transport system permease protein n=1 Tax=Rheinheimera pacifica TaxID=173990 RepID=A0A1H6ML98_9GAMM|nr:ABC transporter permease [Rheinheimera pacifica]MDR6983988.1 putative ABC transport system permease protein [Rheinheimera pacifica]SEH99285.1 putative ABC transport system permease protein [Rheinheimera pacifica]
MNSLTLLQVAWVALRVNLLRSILTMLGIIIGVAAVIIMLALGAGARYDVDQQIKSLGGNVFVVFARGRFMGGAREASGSSQGLTEMDAQAIEQQIPEVNVAAPTLRASGQLIYGNLNWAPEIHGVDNKIYTAQSWELAEGRSFSDTELASAGRVAVIGQTVKRELFGAADALGQTVRVNKMPVTIIGVLKGKGQNTQGNDQDDLIFMPLDTVRKRIAGMTLSSPKAVRSIIVQVTDERDMAIVEQQLDSLLRQRLRISDNQSGFSIRNLAEMVETRSQTMQIFNGLLAAVASVSLLVGGIGIMNIMLVSVTERTREIGLRMAVGAEPRIILKQFLVEAVLLCAMGGLIGLTLAVAVSLGLEYFAGFTAIIQPQVVVMSLGFSCLIGVFFGYYPATKAARMQPIEALRFE